MFREGLLKLILFTTTRWVSYSGGGTSQPLGRFRTVEVGLPAQTAQTNSDMDYEQVRSYSSSGMPPDLHRCAKCTNITLRNHYRINVWLNSTDTNNLDFQYFISVCVCM